MIWPFCAKRSAVAATDCASHPSGFFFSGDRITLCKVACDVAQADPQATLDVRYGCTLPPPE